MPSPQTIFAVRTESESQSLGLLKLHVRMGRVLLAAGGHARRAPMGREDPTVHVEAAITHAVAFSSLTAIREHCGACSYLAAEPL